MQGSLRKINRIRILYSIKHYQRMTPVFQRLLFAALLFVSLATLTSCSSSTSSPETQTGIFPTRLGVVWTYANFDDTTSTQRTGTTTVTNGFNTQLSGRSAIGQPTRFTPTSGASTSDTIFVSVEGNSADQFIYLTSLNDLFQEIPGVQIRSGFPVGWYPFLRTSGGAGSVYRIFDGVSVNATIQGLGNATIGATAEGRVDGQETISVGGRSYNATRLTITANLNVQIVGAPAALPLRPILRVWVAPNVGVVRQQLNPISIALAGINIPGSRQDLVSVSGN